MGKRVPEAESARAVEPQAPIWSARRRRPLFLLLLVAGLVIMLVWMPAEVRASLWKALRAQRGLIALLFLFALVTLSLIWSAGERLDAQIFLLLNQRRYPKWLDGFMWVATQIGNMVTAFGLALWFYLTQRRNLAFEIVIGTITLWLLVETIKSIADRDRPFRALADTRIIGWRERGESFPSGHTAQTFFMITLFVLYFPFSLEVNVVLYAVAALVGFTRIYVGAHYPRDVFGGAVLGSIWGILAILVNPFLFIGLFLLN